MNESQLENMSREEIAVAWRLVVEGPQKTEDFEGLSHEQIKTAWHEATDAAQSEAQAEFTKSHHLSPENAELLLKILIAQANSRGEEPVINAETLEAAYQELVHGRDMTDDYALYGIGGDPRYRLSPPEKASKLIWDVGPLNGIKGRAPRPVAGVSYRGRLPGANRI